jgi:hypothetical protein
MKTENLLDVRRGKDTIGFSVPKTKVSNIRQEREREREREVRRSW